MYLNILRHRENCEEIRVLTKHLKIFIQILNMEITQFDYICIKTFYYLSYIKIELTSIFNAKVKFSAKKNTFNIALQGR